MREPNHPLELEARALIVMGVSGSGKSTVGQKLADKLGWLFFDADDFHPQANIDKMASGQPLNDSDRQPWLEALNALIGESLSQGNSLVLACSALKVSYRRTLEHAHKDQTTFIYLKGDFDTIFRRMQTREGHYMKAEMLRSQFEALEPPEDAITLAIEQDINSLITQVLAQLS